MKCYMYVMLCYVNVIRGVEVPSNCKCVCMCVLGAHKCMPEFEKVDRMK